MLKYASFFSRIKVSSGQLTGWIATQVSARVELVHTLPTDRKRTIDWMNHNAHSIRLEATEEKEKERK